MNLQEAYELAESCDCMLIYANAIEQTENLQLFTQLSEHFSSKSSNLLMAGKFAGLAKNYSLVSLITYNKLQKL